MSKIIAMSASDSVVIFQFLYVCMSIHSISIRLHCYCVHALTFWVIGSIVVKSVTIKDYKYDFESIVDVLMVPEVMGKKSKWSENESMKTMNNSN